MSENETHNSIEHLLKNCKLIHSFNSVVCNEGYGEVVINLEEGSYSTQRIFPQERLASVKLPD